MARTTAPPGGRRTPQGGTRRGYGRERSYVRIRTGLLEWMLALMAREWAAPWLVAFVLLPAIGQLMHAGWSGYGWSWLLAAGFVLVGGPIGLALHPYVKRLAKGGRPKRYTPEQWMRIVRRWQAATHATGGLALLTFHEAARRGLIGRWRIAWAVAGVFTSLAVTLRAGLINQPVFPVYSDAAGLHTRWPLDVNLWWFVVYTVAAGVLCVALNLRNTQAVRGDGTEEDIVEGVDLQEIFKTKVPVKVIPGSAEDIADGAAREVMLYHPGATTADIQPELPALASSVGGLPHEGHLAVRGPHPEYTRVTLLQKEQLTELQPWPGPQFPGEFPDVPVRVGLHQDGYPAEIVRYQNIPGVTPFDPALSRWMRKQWYMSNVLISGMMNAGKTEAELLEIAELITRKAIVIWWIDIVKAGQTANDIRPAIDWLATSPQEAYRMIRALGVYVTWAAEVLGQHHFREWNRRAWEVCGIPAVLVHIEEFNSVKDPLGRHIVRRGEQVRSVGASISASSQRPDAENMPTGFRSQLGTGWCFGVHDASDAMFTLSEPTLKAGADPGQWLNVNPGKFYLEAQQMDPNRWPVPGRSFHRLEPQAMRAHSAQFAPHMVEMPTQWVQTARTPADQESAEHYLRRAKVTTAQWVEANGIVVPGHTQTPTREVINVTTAPPTMPLPVQPPMQPPAQPATQTPAEDARPAAARSSEDDPDDPDMDLTRQLDQEENMQTLRALRDPAIAADLEATDPRRSPMDGFDPDDYEDVPLGDQRPAVDMPTPEARSAALVDGVFRPLFEAHGWPEYRDVDSRTLVDMWEDTGALGGPGNRRNALSRRLERLIEEGHVERLESGEGRRPSRYRIYRSVFGPPAADSEPDDDGDDEE